MDLDKIFDKAIDENLHSAVERRSSILIVDDDKDSFDILSATLRIAELGDLQIQWACNGLEALQECDRQVPDIILLDILMPEMDGFQFIHEFRKRPGAATVSVIFISTLDAVGERIRGLDMGAIDFISKPFNPVEVALRVGRHLEIHRLMKEVEKQREIFSDQATILDTIFNNVPSGLAVLDRRYRVLHHNQPFGTFFPASPGPLAGQNFLDLVRREKDGEDDSLGMVAKDFLARAFDGEKVAALPLDLHPGDILKEAFHLSMLPTPFPHREDCLLLELRNITELIEAERRIALLDRLAMLGQISVGVAHEVNNPTGFIRLKAHNLQTIASALAPILDESLKNNPDIKVGRLSVGEMRERQDEAVDGILKATERIAMVVDRLKSFGRDEKSAMEEVDLKEVIETAVQIIGYQLGNAEEVEIDIPDESLPPTRGNRIEFEQVLVNLLMNAIQSIGERREAEGNGYEGKISIRVVPASHEVGIFVSDNGKGIPEKMKSKIFMPYFTTKERGKGTGLGLSISHELVSKHGGRIEVDGTPMKGAIMKVFVPVEATPIPKIHASEG